MLLSAIRTALNYVLIVRTTGQLTYLFPGTSLHLFLRRTEEDGLPARAQFTDWGLSLVSRPDSS